jgi:uncharacterized membrane-anchored protein
MMKNRLELSVVYFMRYCITGFMWIVYGILNFYDDEIFALKIVSTICMVIAISFTLASIFIRQDKEDYASHLHLMQACTATVFVILLLVMAAAIISAFIPKDSLDFNFNMLYPFIIGMVLFMIGGIFIYCEKWGDDTWVA